MKTLIFEQWPGGHHFNYLECITEALSAISDQVIVAMPHKAANSDAFNRVRTALTSLGNVMFDEEVEDLGDDSSKASGQAVARNAYLALKRASPNHVLLPTADAFFVELAAILLTFGRTVLSQTKIEAVIHNKKFSGASSWPGRIAVGARRATVLAGAYSRINFVNFLLSDGWAEPALRRGTVKIGIVGDPVPEPPRVSKFEARRELGLSADAQYLGIVGSLSGLKAVPETLAAFRSCANRSQSKLLLAGMLSRRFKELLNRDYGDLVAGGRIVCLDRFLTPDELWMAMAAIDVHCSVYDMFFGLSSLMLKCIAQNTPVITHNYGWAGEIVRRFGVGFATNIKNSEEYSTDMLVALQNCKEYRRTEAVERLLKFHSIKNFTDGVTEDIAAAVGKTRTIQAIKWSWVVEALD